MLSVKIQTTSQTLQPVIRREGKVYKINFFITPTNVNSPGNANPYVAGGDTLDLTQLFSLAAGAPGQALPSFELPINVTIKSFRAALGAGYGNLYLYQFAPGTTLANGTMQVLTGAAAQTGLTELSAGNYPAGVLDDSILAVAEFYMP